MKTRLPQHGFALCVAALLLATASISWAQDGDAPPRGRERGGFGPGGPGGPGRMPGIMPSSAVALLAMPEVQDELKLSEDQKKQVAEQVGRFEDGIATVMGAARDLAPEEREQHMAEIRLTLEEASRRADEKLATMLDAKQSERLGQLRIQRDGLAALLTPNVRTSLALTDEQVGKLRAIRDQSAGPFGVPRDVREKMQSDALAVLTDEQRTRFAALKGAAFTFPQPRGGPGGPGGGGPMQPERKLVKEFDADHDGKLDSEERAKARASIKQSDGGGRRSGRGPGGFGGEPTEPTKPGDKISPSDVKPLDGGLYEPTVLRTLFLDFDAPDWEAELADFYRSDVDVPATLTVDGKVYPNVGVHFRGASSYFAVGEGSKRSLNVTLDDVDSKQRLYGYSTLNLLNSHEDPTFLHTVLYLDAARQHIPAPKANFVKVVINGESWGVYVSAQQFDKQFVAENYGTPKGTAAKGTRWKVQGSPGGRGGLEYLGEDIEPYKARYSMKSGGGTSGGNSDDAWKKLVRLCRTLNETPLDQLEAALKPMLDVDGALWFLALETALINGDGYWIRASDYAIFLDEHGMFHIIPHDANETFAPPSGPGMGGGPRGGRGAGPGGGGPGAGPGGGGPGAGPGGGGPGAGPGGGGVNLDPLVGLDDKTKPLRSRLLAVPSLKARYLTHVKTIADEWLDWSKLGKVVAQYRSLIEKEVESDTRKLTSFAAFQQTLSEDVSSAPAGEPGGRPGRVTLRSFADQRRAYLLNHPEIKKLSASEAPPTTQKAGS